jgi:hypothetical protein
MDGRYLRLLVNELIASRATDPHQRKQVLNAISGLSDAELLAIMDPQLNEIYVELMVVGGVNPFATRPRDPTSLSDDGE